MPLSRRPGGGAEPGGQGLRILKGAHYPMGVAVRSGKVYVASSAVDWSGQVRGKPELLVYGPEGEEPLSRQPFPQTFGYPQTLLATEGRLFVATTWGYVLLLDPGSLSLRSAFALPETLNPIRGMALGPDGFLYLTGSKDGDGRLVRVPLSALLDVPEPQNLDRFAQVLAKGLPDPWGVDLVKGVLYLVTSTDPKGTGPGGLYRLEAEG